jgi:hypothetical protein
VNEGFGGLMDSLERAHRKGYMPDAITEDYEGFDYRDAAPTAQPSRPDDQPEYTDSEFGFLVDTLNGLTEQETAASASVAGLSGAQPEAPAEPAETVTQIECRECSNCGHIGINDGHDTDAACSACDWSGTSPDEDKCPGCGSEGTMVTACPKCSNQYRVIAEMRLATPAPVAQQPAELTQQAANWVRDGIVDFIGDNWPDRKFTLEEITAAVQGIEIHPLRFNIKAQGGSH